MVSNSGLPRTDNTPMRVAFIASLGLVAVALCAEPAAADRTRVRKAPTPRWVEPVELPAFAHPPPSAVAYYDVLLDRQRSHLRGQRVDYMHHARKVLIDDGISAAGSISATFEATYQKLDLHYVRVHRDGAVIDALEVAQLRVARVERDHRSRLYSAVVEVSYEVPDVRAGDIVEWAYTVRGDNPVYGGAILGGLSLQFGVPVAHLRYRVLVPRGQELSIGMRGTQRRLERRPGARFDELRYETWDVSALRPDGQRPDWYDAWPVATYSSFTDWGQVARWATALYEPAVKPDRAVRELAAELRAGHREPLDRVRAAVRFVQDEVRYVGIELGEHSHRPHRAGEVLAQRFGDCKDKSSLLIALLREIGVPADAMLVDSDAGRRLDRAIPSPHAFDHVIVRANLGTDELWIDPTENRSRRPLSHPPRYHWALAARSDTAALQAIPALWPEEPTIDITETIAPDGASWTLHVKTRYRGDNADALRRRLGRESRERISDSYLEHYAAVYDDLELDGDIEITDNEADNLIIVDERYRMPSFYDDGVRSVGPRDLLVYLREPRVRERSAPFALPHPLHIRQTIVVRVGDGAYEPMDERVENPYFDYRLEASHSGGELRVAASLFTFADHVAADDIDSYLDELDRVGAASSYELRAGDEGDNELPPGSVSVMLGWLAAAVVITGALVLVIVLVNRRVSRKPELPPAAHAAYHGAPPPPYPTAPPAGPPPEWGAPVSHYIEHSGRGNGHATAALWLGISGILVMPLLGVNVVLNILAVVFGGLGLNRARELGGTGRGSALAGLIIGSVTLVLTLAVFVALAMGVS